jgi:hypothetical protein
MDYGMATDGARVSMSGGEASVTQSMKSCPVVTNLLQGIRCECRSPSGECDVKSPRQRHFRHFTGDRATKRYTVTLRMMGHRAFVGQLKRAKAVQESGAARTNQGESR